MRDSKGFSLLEVMIVAGMMGGLALAGMKVMDNVKQIQRDASLFQDRLMVMQNLNLNSIQPDCGLDLSGIQVPNSVSLDSWKHNLSKLGGPQELKVGQEIGGLEISKIKLQNPVKSATDPNLYYADLALRLDKGKGALGGKYYNEQKTKVTVALSTNSSGDVTDCTTVQESAEIAKTCNALGLPLAADGKSCVPNPIPREKVYLRAEFCPDGDSSCTYKRAECEEGDLALSGDCYGGGKDGVQGDLVLSLPSGTDCSGCPNDASKCDDACYNRDYLGYGCNYYHSSVNLYKKGARILCMKRPKESEIHPSVLDNYDLYKDINVQQFIDPNQINLPNLSFPSP